MILTKKSSIYIYIEKSAEKGIYDIAETFAEDISYVLGKKSDIVSLDTVGAGLEDGANCGADSNIGLNGSLNADAVGIFVLEAGKSALYEKACKDGLLDAQKIDGKREVFAIQPVTDFCGVEKALLIAGSEKRGCIYGMFTVSEYIGVSPWVFFGDIAPKKRDVIEIGNDIAQYSKEPSVRFRGFFINDEWPCFGNWVMKNYGGFNAKCYRKIFEVLLRLKGNYLWPAMWTSSFPLDGPGDADMELADRLGVVMGTSHHEPCIRASEEWDIVRGPETVYGNEWNYYTNENGLKQYWSDSLEARAKYETVITIGMRGERDTSMLGPDATLAENIGLLRKIIHDQNTLIKKYVNEDLSKVPRMIALYKEVEAYFYGDENTPGLKDDPELDDVICMFSEDNFGHLRSVPSEEIRKRNGGFGMYYHLDYHGDPISWEWIDAMKPTQMREQMSEAYEYGIRDLWIVNVGDIKFHEVSMGYFLKLAYDYESYGYPAEDGVDRFLADYAKDICPDDRKLQKRIAKAFNEFQHLMFLRRPEALHAGVFHPCNEMETERILARADALQEESDSIMKALPARYRDGYYSTLHYQLTAGINNLRMHLFGGKNAHYAAQARLIANDYAKKIRACIAKDDSLKREWRRFKNGKWFGMELAPHVGFTKWNEDGKRYPVLSYVEPLRAPEQSISRADGEKVAYKNYAVNDYIELFDFLDEGCDELTIEIANGGTGLVKYEIVPEKGEWPEFIEIKEKKGTLKTLKQLKIKIHREKMKNEYEEVKLTVVDGKPGQDSNGRRAGQDFFIKAWKGDPTIPAGTPVMNGKGVVAEAAKPVKCIDTKRGAFTILKDYGKYEGAILTMPVLADFNDRTDRPEAVYEVALPKDGDYIVRLYCSPTNPVEAGREKRISVHAGNEVKDVMILPATFGVGKPKNVRWCQGVLDQIHIAETEFTLKKGIQEIGLLPLDPCVPVERILVYQKNNPPKDSYLGPVAAVKKA